MMRPSLPPRSLTLAGLVAAALISAANPLADALGLKYWASGWGPRKLHALQASELAPEVLILGSSRMDAALVARHLERRLEAELGRRVVAYNAAQAATGASEPAWILRDLVASNGCPTAVVVDVHVEGLNAGSERLRRSLGVYTSLADLTGALPEVALDPELLDALLGSPFRGFANLTRRLVLPPDSPREAKLARAFLARHGSKYGEWVPPGGELAKSLATRTPREIEREARGRRAFLVTEHHLDRFRLGGLPVANLERLADRAVGCGAALLLVELPTRYRMAEWGFAPVEAEARQYLEEFARRRGAVHLDLARALEPLAEADFFDLSHLSFQGAIKASDAIVPALVEVLEVPPSAGVSLRAPEPLPVPTVFLTELHRLPEARRVKLVFDDGTAGEVAYDTLRGYCPCAACQGHWAEAIQFHAPAKSVEPVNIEPVGNYGVSFHWSDGHATGIYRFDFLRQVALRAGADDQPPIRLEDPA